MLKRVLGSLKKAVYKPYVARLDINGDIDHEKSHQIIKSLKALNPNGLEAIALTVNSQGGSAAQAVIICERLDQFCKKHEVPLLTFAQDASLSAGYMVLSKGDEVYCSPNSVMGSIGAIYRNMKFHRLFAKYGIDYTTYSVNKGKLTNLIDPFIDNVRLHRQSNHLKRFAKNTHTLIGNFVKRNRGSKVSSVKKIWEGELLTGTDAYGYGLVDGIETYQEYLEKKYPGIKIKNCTKGSYLERVEDLIGPFTVRSDFDLLKKKMMISLLKE